MIRKLEKKDAEFMYEWMHEVEVTKNLQADFGSFSLSKVEAFIDKASTQTLSDDNLHYAIVNEDDEYMGTISLKNINPKDKNAEYAIVTRRCAHGKGYAFIATMDIFKVAFNDVKLEKVYLYVSTQNVAANKFYRKCGFIEEGVFRKHISISNELVDIRWYSKLKEEYEEIM